MKRDVTDYTYAIICGATKSATTSLYFYLAHHPQVAPSSLKETRFFLDVDYPSEAFPLKSKFRFDEGIDKYDRFFPDCRQNMTIRLEATPDYLYSPGTAARIYSALPRRHLIFVLREPAARLFSWYRFAAQNGDIPKQMIPDDYINRQIKYEGRQRPQHFASLEQGCYSRYLKSYFALFSEKEITVLFFEELYRDPKRVLKQLCRDLDIDPLFYDTYEFSIHNKTGAPRYPLLNKAYRKIGFHLRYMLYNKKNIRALLKPINEWINDQILVDKNRGSGYNNLSGSAKALLADYYQQEYRNLEKLLGREVPW